MSDSEIEGEPAIISVESLLLASFEILMIATGLSRLLFYPIPRLEKEIFDCIALGPIIHMSR